MKQSKKSALHHTKNNPLLFTFVLLTFAIAGYFLIASKATALPPRIYLAPPTQVLAINQTFTVQVREYSGTDANNNPVPVNSVAANFSYNANLVDFVSISAAAAPWGTNFTSTGASGQVNITRGVSCSTTCPPTTGDNLVATVTFKAKTTGGAAAMAFTSGTGLASSATQQDILGGLTNTTGGTYTIDTTQPTVSLTPANGASVSGGGNVPIVVTATDTQSSIASVDVFIDGSCTTNTGKVATLTTSPYTYNWNTAPPVVLGGHQLQARATDSSGNTICSAVSNITLADQTPPSAPGSLTSPNSTTTAISLAWTASADNAGGSGLAGYRVSRNGTVLTNPILGPTTLSYTDSSGLSPSTSYTYTVVALDSAGNVSSAATLPASTKALVPGDADGDGHVSQGDLTILVVNINSAYASFCDFNKDGKLDFLDVAILLANYGT